MPNRPLRHCVIVPFLDRLDQVAECAENLLAQAGREATLLLVDDGSVPAAAGSPLLRKVLSDRRVRLVRHAENRGIGAARNSALRWCRENRVELAIMVDSDCLPGPGLIDGHLALHAEFPEAACIGATIVGSGVADPSASLWERLDSLASWLHIPPGGTGSSPGGDDAPAGPAVRPVLQPYHLPTTNFSVRMERLPERDFVFDERLLTGEDCLLVRELRRMHGGRPGGEVLFAASPVAAHRDRKEMAAVFRHHYEWGLHEYFVQFGGDLAPRIFHPLYRLAFLLAFLPALPLFALAGALLNSRSLPRHGAWALPYFPLVYLLWIGKGLAILKSAAAPRSCLREGRAAVRYEEATAIGGGAARSSTSTCPSPAR